MKLVSKISLSLGVAVFLFACNSVDFKKTSAGVPYKIFNKGKGDSVKVNYFVKFQVIQTLRDSANKDTLLYSSYAQNMAEYTQVQPAFNPITYADFRSNMLEVLAKTKKGDSVYMVQSTDSLIKANPQAAAQIKKGGQIITTLRVVDVFKTADEVNAAYKKDMEPKMKEAIANAAKMEQENLQKFKQDTAVTAQMNKDNKIIEDYLKSKNIQTQKTDWGVYYQILNPGQGDKPALGKYVTVKYSGSHMNGEVFDSGSFPLQIGTPGAIKGFEEGVRQLAKGGRAMIYIPSMLGYGAQGSAPKIKPNENLIFDITVLDISDTPPQQGAPQPTDPSGK